MNCPNCDKKPVGIFHSFRPPKLGFKKMFQGYFKCRHCGSILRQKKSSVIFPQFKKSFWIYYLLYILLIVGLGYGVLHSIIVFGFEMIPTIFVIAAYAIIITGIGGELRRRFWVIEEADPEQDTQTSEKMTTTGVVIFVLHSVISGGLAIWLIKNIEITQISNTVFLGGSFLYLAVVMAIAIWILKIFSFQPEESMSEG